MPMLEQYYNGKLVHSLEISFEGLDTAEERAFHIQGLCEWMKVKNDVDNCDFIIDRVPSLANKLIPEIAPAEVIIKNFKPAVVATTPPAIKVPAETKKHGIAVKKGGTGNFEKETKRPFVRPKADHTNPNWLE